jgi:hypothetical protein
MDFDERWEYEHQFKAQWQVIDQPIKFTLLDGREFTFEEYYTTWIDIRDGQRKYDNNKVYQLRDYIVSEAGIPRDALVMFNTDTGERIDPYYPAAMDDIPRDLANVLVMTE